MFNNIENLVNYFLNMINVQYETIQLTFSQYEL